MLLHQSSCPFPSLAPNTSAQHFLNTLSFILPVMSQALGLTQIPESQLQQTHDVPRGSNDIYNDPSVPSIAPDKCPENPLGDDTSQQKIPGSHFHENLTGRDNPAFANTFGGGSDSEGDSGWDGGTADSNRLRSKPTCVERDDIPSPISQSFSEHSQKRAREDDCFADADHDELPTAKRTCLGQYSQGSFADIEDYITDISGIPSGVELPELSETELLGILQQSDWTPQNGENNANNGQKLNTQHHNRGNCVGQARGTSESRFRPVTSYNSPDFDTGILGDIASINVNYFEAREMCPGSYGIPHNPENITDGANQAFYNTPNPTERSTTPDSLFDEASSPVNLPQENSLPPNNSTGVCAKENHMEPPSTVTKPLSLPPPPPCSSSPQAVPQSPAPVTAKRVESTFELSTGDLLGAQIREVFRHQQQAPRYISPYPRVGGPLGYLPSSPSLHTKCVEVSTDEVVERMRKYRQRIHSVAYERDKYMQSNAEKALIDSRTGKTTSQMMKEEIGSLKRSMYSQNKKTEQLRREADEWRTRFDQVTQTYNNLVHNFYMIPRCQSGNFSIPLPQQAMPPARPPTPSLSTHSGTATPPVGSTLPTPVSMASTENLQPQQVTTIDLSDDDNGREVCNNNNNNNNPTSEQAPSEESSRENSGNMLLDTMRRKDYSWLGSRNHMRNNLQQAPSPQGQRQQQQHRAETALSSGTHGREGNGAGSNTVDLTRENNIEKDVGMAREEDDENDEFARMLQAQLEGTT